MSKAYAAEVRRSHIDVVKVGVVETHSTEIGAVKLRGGNCLGTYQTLVNPGRAIPPEITVLTGITEQMVYRAPRIEAILSSFLDFGGGDVAVLVGLLIR